MPENTELTTVEETVEKPTKYLFILDENDPAGQFKTTKVLPKMSFMKFSRAFKKGVEADMAVAFIDLCYAIVRDPEERERLDEYIDTREDVGIEELGNALNKWSEMIQNRPLDQSQSSSVSLTETQPTSRVVSFDADTD